MRPVHAVATSIQYLARPLQPPPGFDHGPYRVHGGRGNRTYDDPSRVWPRVEPVKFTSLVKTQLVQRLVVAVEQRTVSWPRAWSVLTDEMKRYEYAIGASGAITYSAPSGFHDDCVMALALAAAGRQNVSHVGSMVILRTSRYRAALVTPTRILF
jgi:hypothetical protein